MQSLYQFFLTPRYIFQKDIYHKYQTGKTQENKKRGKKEGRKGDEGREKDTEKEGRWEEIKKRTIRREIQNKFFFFLRGLKSQHFFFRIYVKHLYLKCSATYCC